MKSSSGHSAPSTPLEIDSPLLKSLVGYHARRATNKILDLFHERMNAHGLTPAEFAVLHVIGHNPSVTPSRLCAELNLLPPKLAKILRRLGERRYIERNSPVQDRRAVLLKLSAAGRKFMTVAEAEVVKLEADATAKLTLRQRATLIQLLQKIYL